ncbi:DNA-dependent metalloprotease WSS1 [Cladorrhinum sp. PSN332]|nr:DNA-dependent metalloprotease WSS1 [Cladorrhinum sp. PSN332]
MPIGIQRLNAKKSQPNERIVFIKPLGGPDEEIARDFLERIAAQCSPIMKTHHLSVMSLEEYEPNPEFVGRNFNAGEVIQLVLKARSGRWLPFSYVQMVMMHELAHCKQMNHSKAFWAVRNAYAEEMRGLWGRKYTGEGLWGRGALLATGEWEKNSADPGDDALPEHLCGGTYRSRILNKFGANGVALGEDAETKVKLEKGKKVVGKPRVAGSARGRELRAAAALARFDQQKKEEEDVVKEEEEGSETDSGEDYEEIDEEEGDIKSEPDALDIDGKRILDGKGRGMVKVCEDENVGDDLDAQQELRELLDFGSRKDGRKGTEKISSAQITISKPKPPPIPSTTDGSPVYLSSKPTKKAVATNSNNGEFVYKPATAVPTTCPICSFSNEQLSATCAMCANVLDPRRAPGSWACTSQICKGTSEYRNAGDSGVCGVCGERKRPTG